MKTYQKFLIAVLLLFGTQLKAQEIPVLAESDLIKASELKTKSGWIKIYLDSKFQKASNPELSKYEYYEFVNMKGQYNSTYTASLPFPKDAGRIEYTGSKLLNGNVKFYDKENKLMLQIVFKDGYYLKVADWKNGNQNTIIEYLPAKNSVELYANYFDSKGKLKSTSHEVNTGTEYKTIDSQRAVAPMSN